MPTPDRGAKPPTPDRGTRDLSRDPDAKVLSLALAALRLPLEEVVERFDTIARGVPSSSPAADALDRARRAAFEAKRILDSLHLLSRPAKTPAQVDASVVTGVVKAAKTVFATDTLEIIDFVPGGLPPGTAEPAALRFAILNLIAASVRGCVGTGLVNVIARAGEEGGLLVEVSDEGPAIPVASRATLFDPVAEETGPRTGLALHLARRLAERAGAQLDLSPRARGAAFAVRIPPKK